MNRLTKIDGIGQNEIIKCFECGLEKAGAELERCGYCEHWQTVLDRLASIEAILFDDDDKEIVSIDRLRELVQRDIPMQPVRSTVLTGKLAEHAMKKGLQNYETYRCPACGISVRERGLTGWRITDYCQKCGQRLINVYTGAETAQQEADYAL